MTATTDQRGKLLSLVVDSYVGSREFNGVLGLHIAEAMGVKWDDVKRTVEALIREGLVQIVHEDWFPNPHIRPFDGPSMDEQATKLRQATSKSVGLYPTPAALAGRRIPRRFAGRPYSARLWRGEPQFRIVFFDMAVLERYRDDPRYHFQFHDSGGFIGVKDEPYGSSEFPSRDKVLLQTFGVGRDGNDGKVAAVFLWYLHVLTPEHQRIWEAFERKDDCRINPDYFRSAMGEFTRRGSIYYATLLEQRVINEMCQPIGRPRLFRRTFESDRPAGFHTIFLPTRANFYAFVNELDKVLSQNIDARFFRDEVPSTRQKRRKDGSISEEKRGTIELLEDWLGTYFRTKDTSAVPRVIDSLREVRRERQTPAHRVATNEHDPSYWRRQDDLMERVYAGLRTLRLILANFPGAETVDIPGWLDEGRIRLD